MTQSVELLLDAESEAVVLREWARLAEAGLPTERRVEPSPTHRPHVTLWAGAAISADIDASLPAMVAGLELPLLLGSLLVFGRGAARSCWSVRWCRAPGCWTCRRGWRNVAGPRPTATSRRGVGARTSPWRAASRSDRLGVVVATLGEVPDVAATSRTCRRWDGDAKVAWDLA